MLFEAWKRSARPAYFFLDSVDEAKIRRQSDFYVAMDKGWQVAGIKKPPRHIGNGNTKRIWTPQEDTVVLGATDFVRTATMLNRTVGAVKYRRLLCRAWAGQGR